MISLIDSITLSLAKFRSSLGRTILTVVISSILFALIICASLLSTGASNSLSQFNKVGINGMYLAEAVPDGPLAGGVLGSPEIIKLAQEYQTSMISKKVQEAKRLGIEYDPKAEIQAVYSNLIPGTSTPTQSINIQSYAAQEAIKEYINLHPSPGLQVLLSQAQPYDVKEVFPESPVVLSGGSLEMMPNGKEVFTTDQNTLVNNDFMHNQQITEEDSRLVQSYIVPGVSIDKNAVPIMMTYDDAATFLGIKNTSSNASGEEKYIKLLYAKIQNSKSEITVCYRNVSSMSLIDQAISIKESETNDIQASQSGIEYGLPNSSSCGEATVIKDTRTVFEKQQEAAQAVFNNEFGASTIPVQKKITFQIIGLLPNSISSQSTTLSSLLKNVVSSSLNNGYIIPSVQFTEMNNFNEIHNLFFEANSNTIGSPTTSYIVKFTNAYDARNYITHQTCIAREDGSCATRGKSFRISVYGNNSLALDDLVHKAEMIILLGLIAVTILAVIFMSLLIGRTIVDSRKETAVFRALGAKRSDISVIYLQLSSITIISIVILSMAIGIASTFFLEQVFSPPLTLQAKLLFGAVNTNLELRLIGLNYAVLTAVVVSIVISGYLSILIPLIRNIRRNPAKDLKED